MPDPSWHALLEFDPAILTNDMHGSGGSVATFADLGALAAAFTVGGVVTIPKELEIRVRESNLVYRWAYELSQWIQVTGTNAGETWPDPVLSIETAPPGGEVGGERYLVGPSGASGAFTGHENEIAEYNGSSFDFTTPSEGNMVYVIALGWLFLFGGTQWACQPVNKAVPTNAQLPTYLEQVTGMPEPKHWFAVAVHGGKLYISGGANDGAPESVSMRVYDPNTNKWEDLPDLPLARQDHGSAALNGKIYIAAGLDGVGYLDRVDVYDPVTKTYTQAKEMPVPLSDTAIVSAEGKLYVIGGGDGSAHVDTVYAYDPMTNAWETKTPMSIPRQVAEVVYLNGKIYIFGGETTGGAPDDTAEVYDIATDTWSAVTSLPDARTAYSIGEVNGKIYIVGGFVGGSFVNTALVYDPALDTYEEIAVLPAYLAGAVGCSVNGVYYNLGGLGYVPGPPSGPPGSNDDVFAFIPSMNKWVTQAGWYYSNHAKERPGNEVQFVLNNAEQQQVAAIAYCMGGF